MGKVKLFCPECLKKWEVELEKGKKPFCSCGTLLDKDERKDN